jgi:3-dehydroquinate dehydratase-2
VVQAKRGPAYADFQPPIVERAPIPTFVPPRSSVMRILLLNGPNLNLLGQREPEKYGQRTLDAVVSTLRACFPDVEIEARQSNLEGELVTWVQQAGAFDGVVMNAGGYSHTSVALRDAVAAVQVPVVEVHITNLLAREPFRHVSLVGAVCKGSIMGLGTDGYRLAVDHLVRSKAEASS